MKQLDYKEMFKQRRLQNIDKVKDALENNEEWLELKINNHIEKWGEILDKETLIYEFNTTKTVPTFFAKDPSRQNLTENYCKDFLEQFEEIKSVDLLPKGGKKALSIVDGKIDFTKNLIDTKSTKSLDLKIILSNNQVILASHKYTNEKGGAQDNQKRDQEMFIRNAALYVGNEYTFMAICDGDYYTENTLKGLKKLSKDRVIVCQSTDILSELHNKNII